MLNKLGRSKIIVFGLIAMLIAATAAIVFASLGGSPGGAPAEAPAKEPLLFYVPKNDVTGTMANSKFIFTGKKVSAEFCSGSRTGVSQGMVVVYTGSDPAAQTVVITTNGENPGTRIPAPTDNGKDCTDSGIGDIHEYSGTSE